MTQVMLCVVPILHHKCVKYVQSYNYCDGMTWFGLSTKLRYVKQG